MTTADDVLKAVDRFINARPSLKEAMRDSAMILSIRLNRERRELEAKMEQRWRWCAANWTEDIENLTGWSDDPRFDDRESVLLHEMQVYQQIVLALDAAMVALYPLATDRTPERMAVFA